MKVKLGDLIIKIVGNEDRLTTRLDRYVAGEHIESSRITVNKYGILNDKTRNTLGYQFHYPFEKGDILFMTKNPYLKKCGMVDFPGICSIATFVIRTRNEEVIRQKFLALLLQTDDFWNYLEANKSGSVNYFITWKTLENYLLELPDLVTQDKLIELIWKLEESRNKYEKLMSATSQLLHSKYEDLFKETDKVAIGSVCEVKARIGWQGLKQSEFLDEGDFLLVTGIDIKKNRIDFSNCKYVTEDRYNQDTNIQLHENDILITKDGTIGKVAIIENLPGPATLNSGLFVVRSNEQLNQWFLFYALQSLEFIDFIESCKTGSTIPHLNQKAFINHLIPLPNLEKQNEFVNFAKTVEASKADIEKQIININLMIKNIVANALIKKED